jgi:hemoglobin/transferrin/lactoferrin receptor protein
MRFTLIVSILCVVFSLKAQKVKIFSSDSVPIYKVLIANLNMDETVFTNKKGDVELTIFQDENELLQIIHKSYQSIFLTKKQLTILRTIFLLKTSNEIAPVEVSISSKTKESIFELVTQTKSISKENIQQQGPSNTADLLEGTGEVQIQKTQLGGGSPIIRGFEANRILLVVDGIRMNNAIYRSGHIQNALSVDMNILSGVEVIFGPNSLIYGSDALGGVIHFKTQDPKVKKDTVSVEQIGGVLRYQSAMNSSNININYQNGSKKFAYLIGITQSNFNDLKMGENRFHGYSEFGKIPYYINKINGQDSIVVNTDQNLIKRTGYSQTDLLWKGLYMQNEFNAYTLNFQHSSADVIPRADKLYELDNELLKYSDWDYRENNRSLFSISKETKKQTKAYNSSNIILAYQKIKENRMNSGYQSDTTWWNMEDVSVYSLNADFIKFLDTFKKAKINYGFEGVFNLVASSAYGNKKETNDRYYLKTRYPGGGSNYISGAIYIATQRKIKKSIIKIGARYTITSLEAVFDTNIVTKALNIKRENLFTNAITPSIGYVYKKDNSKIYCSISTAFKTPNIDDFGKVFEKSGNLTVPNINLKPETSINYEIGSSFINRYLDLDLATYFTKVFNLMTKKETNLNGIPDILLNGNKLNLISLQNSGIANIYGLFTALRFKFNNQLNWRTTTTFTKGFLSNSDDIVGHIPPVYGKSSLTYKFRKLKISMYTRFNGRKKWKNFNELSDNPEYAIKGFGSPAWATLNMSFFMYMNSRIRIQVAAENIMDAHYKTFASFISAPGRNIIASIYFKF